MINDNQPNDMPVVKIKGNNEELLNKLILEEVEKELKNRLSKSDEEDKREIIIATEFSKILITLFFYLADFSVFTCATLLVFYFADFNVGFIIAIFCTIFVFEFLIFIFFVRLEVIIKNACMKFLKENLKITFAVIFFFIAQSLSDVGFIILEIILFVLSLIGLVGFFLIRERIIMENEIFNKSICQAVQDDCRFVFCPRSREREELL